MTENFMLKSRLAQNLYHNTAKNLPIIDYHCHISPKEIAENKRYSNIAQIWLTCGDHYKWRAIRSNGFDEHFVTGNAADYDKFLAWATTLPKCIGNPLYIWAHMELKNYFGYGGVLNAETAKRVWDLSLEKLSSDLSMTARGLMEKSNVELICTTDDPSDTLEYHKKIAGDKNFNIKVLPAFRPDKGLHIEKAGFTDYIKNLSKTSGIEINDYKSLCDAYIKRLDFFVLMGCKTADNGFEDIPFRKNSADICAKTVFMKALDNKPLNKEETDTYKTELFLFLAREYYKRSLVMQIHFGVSRNNSDKLWKQYGPDAGADAIGNFNCIVPLTKILNELDKDDMLPKTVLYSINPTDNTAIDALIGCFQNNDCGIEANRSGKMQHGSAWWFNDNNKGMKEQMSELANNSLLANFIGMLTDSRSFLSYARHEYFRRILCGLLADYAENGEYPAEGLERIAADISYYNTKNYFGL